MTSGARDIAHDSVDAALNDAVRAAQSGDPDAAFRGFEAVLRADPGNVAALTNIGILHCQAGDLARGADCLRDARRRDPGDSTVAENLRAALAELTKRAFARKERKEVIALLRESIALRPDDPVLRSDLENILAYEGEVARLADYDPKLDAGARGRTILLACMPKSGSSWLVNALHRLSGFEIARFANAMVENEQELYLPAVRAGAGRDRVVQQHCRASAPNLHLIQAFRMTPVVLVRNLLDTLVSMRDFWDTGAVRNSFLHLDWPGLSPEEKNDALVRHLAPWYVQFYVSWRIAERHGQADMIWVRYEDMIADKAGTLRAVADFCGLTASDDALATVVERVDGNRTATRFNRGVAGRGEETFSADHKDLVRGLTRAFPSIDFAPIGL